MVVDYIVSLIAFNLSKPEPALYARHCARLCGYRCEGTQSLPPWRTLQSREGELYFHKMVKTYSYRSRIRSPWFTPLLQYLLVVWPFQTSWQGKEDPTYFSSLVVTTEFYMRKGIRSAVWVRVGWCWSFGEHSKLVLENIGVPYQSWGRCSWRLWTI